MAWMSLRSNLYSLTAVRSANKLLTTTAWRIAGRDSFALEGSVFIAGAVVGATYPEEIARVRAIAPHLPLLIPGVGAQGGDAATTVKAGLRKQGDVITGPIVVNSSRAILYASSGESFAQAARQAAMDTRAQLRP